MRTLLLLALISPILVNAQITVTSSDFADAGDTIRMSTTTDFTIDIATTGANQTWDYSGLVAEEQYVKEYFDMSSASTFVNVVFGFFASPAYQADYYLPNDDLPLSQVSGILPVPINDVFQYSKKTNDSITAVGFALSVDGNEVPFKSDTIETMYKFPLNYTDTYSSRGFTDMDMNPFVDAIWRQYKQRSTEVDGWGSITTPFGTFDAIRLRHTITEVDSIWFDVLGTGSPFWIPLSLPDKYVYEWWANGQKEALLRIETNDVFGLEVVSSIEYQDNYIEFAGIDEKSNEISIYPNPVGDILHLGGLVQQVDYQIVDMSGNVIESGSTNENVMTSQLVPGQYKIIFDESTGIAPASFIKK